jgi:hypothetical protein
VLILSKGDPSQAFQPNPKPAARERLIYLRFYLMETSAIAKAYLGLSFNIIKSRNLAPNWSYGSSRTQNINFDIASESQAASPQLLPIQFFSTTRNNFPTNSSKFHRAQKNWADFIAQGKTMDWVGEFQLDITNALNSAIRDSDGLEKGRYFIIRISLDDSFSPFEADKVQFWSGNNPKGYGPVISIRKFP